MSAARRDRSEEREEREGYLAPRRAARSEIRDRGSRFLAVVVPARNDDEAKRVLESVRNEFPDATHHCWAWRLGEPPAERSSDDGEPQGTAGVPILQVLRGAELSDLIAIVVRWYGGTKLGKGGLARAYAAATRETVGDLPTGRVVATDRLTVDLPYDRLGALKRLMRPPAIEFVDESYAESVRVELAVYRSQREAFEAALADLGLSAKVDE